MRGLMLPAVLRTVRGTEVSFRSVAWRAKGAAAETSLVGMCRSIKTLRPPYADDVPEEDMRAAALQYVRKISGMRAPTMVHAAAFDQVVDTIAASTRELLQQLQIHPVYR